MSTSESYDQLVDKLARYALHQSINFATGAMDKISILEVARDGDIPREIDGMVPDLYLKSNRRECIGVVLTTKAIGTKHSDAKLTTFMNRARHSDSGIFVLAVPAEAKSIAQQKLNEIEGKWSELMVWEHYTELLA